MRVWLWLGVAAGLAAGVGLCAWADAPTAEQHEVISTGGPMSSLAAATVTNEPFSAIWTNVMVQTLPDGTKVTKRGHHFVARDSEGRVRVERRLTNGKDGTPEIKQVYVEDPVAHTLTIWVEGGAAKKMAMVVELPKEKNGGCELCEPSDSSRPQPVTTTTDLGSQVVDDLPADGKLITTVVPRGRSGNDQPITKTHEVWTSDEMKLVVKQKWEDPRTGERVVQLEKLSRDEPAEVLFHPPANYQTQSALESLKAIMAKLEAAEDKE